MFAIKAHRIDLTFQYQAGPAETTRQVQIVISQDDLLDTNGLYILMKDNNLGNEANIAVLGSAIVLNFEAPKGEQIDLSNLRFKSNGGNGYVNLLYLVHQN